MTASDLYWTGIKEPIKSVCFEVCRVSLSHYFRMHTRAAITRRVVLMNRRLIQRVRRNSKQVYKKSYAAAVQRCARAHSRSYSPAIRMGRGNWRTKPEDEAAHRRIRVIKQNRG